MENVHLQGIGNKDARQAKELNIGDVIMWNYGYKSEVVGMTPSKTGKTINFALRSLEDNIVRNRKVKATTLLVA